MSYTPMAGPTGKVGNKIPSGYKMGQVQNFTPEMMQLFQSLFSHLGGGSYLSRLASGDQSLFAEMEAPAMRQFGELQGNLASRFSGAGGAMSARRGSGFSNAMNQATSDFASQLQAQRQGLQRQAIMDLMNLSGSLLQQRPYESFLTKKAPSFLESLVGAVGENLGSIPQAFMQSQGFGF